jgi:hypothetical protein
MPASDTSPTLPSRTDLGLAAALAVLVSGVYLLTLTPSLSYLSPDGNELATIPYILGLAHPPGYPVYTWLGKLFTLLPFGDVAHRVNLMSATLGAAAAGGVFLIAIWLLPARMPGRRAAAAVSALLLAFGPTVWSQSVIAEVYAPNLAFVALTLLTLLWWEHTRRLRDFFAFALVFGLSLGMHLSDLGFAPALALFILLTDWRQLRRPAWWLAGIAGFGLGVAQYAWVMFRTRTMDPQLLLGRIPDGLAGLFAYTLGSFSELRFAFPLAALPERLVVYLYLLREELGHLAIVVGVIGLVSLLVRRPRHFHLLVGMYLVHIGFFIQYRVFDLEVFFLPAHLLWAVFVAFGVAEILGGAWTLFNRMLSRGRAAQALHAPLAALLVVSMAVPLLRHWREADHSEDVAINDFYSNVWEVLPQNAALLTPGGVFGYDAFYWRLVYDTSPDIVLPSPPSPAAPQAGVEGRALYSTTSRQMLERGAGRWAPSPDLIPGEPWMVPVLIGAQGEADTLTGLTSRSRLTLFELSPEVPRLVQDDAAPAIASDASVGEAILLGADIDSDPVESGGRLHVILYWRLGGVRRIQVSIGLDGDDLESHEIGFGNLVRYQAEAGPVAGRIVVEDYWLVIPSTTSPGTHWLTVGVRGSDSAIDVAPISVVDHQERLERWLSVAG